MLGAFAGSAAVAIENARLFESVRQEKEKMSTILAEIDRRHDALATDAQGVIVLIECVRQNGFWARKRPRDVGRRLRTIFMSNPHGTRSSERWAEGAASMTLAQDRAGFAAGRA